jgi:hypothetical protein
MADAHSGNGRATRRRAERYGTGPGRRVGRSRAVRWGEGNGGRPLPPTELRGSQAVQ